MRLEIRNNAEALKAFLGVSDLPGSAQTNRRADGGRAQVALSGDQVSLSEIGAKVLNSASQENVRLDKVSAVQEAIATGLQSAGRESSRHGDRSDAEQCNHIGRLMC